MLVNEMQVKLIDKMGNDNSVVNAARISFDKAAEQYSPEANEKLIKYLATHNHWSPIAHTALTFHIKAPIFVARQLGKHQVGLVWNEVSRRYVDSPPEYYEPMVWRKKAENVKQGSSDEEVDVSLEGYDSAIRICDGVYRSLLASGVCAEQARAVLPQSMMTEWYWTGSLAAFSRVCKLRLDSHTQKETRDIAEKINNECKQAFPISWKYL